jgi:hypothetical protein
MEFMRTMVPEVSRMEHDERVRRGARAGQTSRVTSRAPQAVRPARQPRFTFTRGLFFGRPSEA